VKQIGIIDVKTAQLADLPYQGEGVWLRAIDDADLPIYVWNYDSAAWVLLDQASGTANFAAIGGAPTDNPALASALNARVPATRTVNGQPLSGDVTIDKASVGLGNADDTADADKPVSGPQAAADDLRGKVTLLTTAQLAAPTAGQLADLRAVYVCSDQAPYRRYRSDGRRLYLLPDALEESSAFNRQSGRIEVDDALGFYQEGPTQGSKLISSTPKRFAGFVLQATSTITRVTFWDQSTATASGSKLMEITSGLTAGAEFLMEEAVSPLNGIYMEVAGGTGTFNVKREG